MNLFNKAVGRGVDETAAVLCVIIPSRMEVSARLHVDAKFIGGAFALALKAARSWCLSANILLIRISTMWGMLAACCWGKRYTTRRCPSQWIARVKSMMGENSQQSDTNEDLRMATVAYKSDRLS